MNFVECIYALCCPFQPFTSCPRERTASKNAASPRHADLPRFVDRLQGQGPHSGMSRTSGTWAWKCGKVMVEKSGLKCKGQHASLGESVATFRSITLLN